MHVWSLFSPVWLLSSPWTTAHQAPHPWDSPGKNTGVGCHRLLLGIFLIQCLSLLHWEAGSLPLVPPENLKPTTPKLKKKKKIFYVFKGKREKEKEGRVFVSNAFETSHTMREKRNPLDGQVKYAHRLDLTTSWRSSRFPRMDPSVGKEARV